MTPLDRLALAALTAYQRHLSPRKGFCCAYRVRYGGPSCSEYARQTLMADGLWRTLPPLRQRLRACRVAAQGLLADQEEQERRKRRRDTALECLPDACPVDVIPDSCDGGCIPDSCGWLRP